MFCHSQCLNKQAGNAGRSWDDAHSVQLQQLLRDAPHTQQLRAGKQGHRPCVPRGTEKGDCSATAEPHLTSKGCCSTWEGYYWVSNENIFIPEWSIISPAVNSGSLETPVSDGTMSDGCGKVCFSPFRRSTTQNCQSHLVSAAQACSEHRSMQMYGQVSAFPLGLLRRHSETSFPPSPHIF